VVAPESGSLVRSTAHSSSTSTKRGNELTEREYFETLLDPAIAFVSILVPSDFMEPQPCVDAAECADLSALIGSGVLGEGLGVVVNPETGQIFDDSGTGITFVQGPIALGEPTSVDRGNDLVAVVQTIRFGDQQFDVRVSSPLQPVTDSIDALRNLLLFAVPALILAIAVTTWLAPSRALSPVHAIASRAREISAQSIDQGLPVP
jgi:hypothetical protein